MCFIQYVEYYIDRGVLGVSKEVSHTIFEYRGAPVPAHNRTKWDSQQNLVVPTMPPTLIGVCRLIQLYYVLKVSVSVLYLQLCIHLLRSLFLPCIFLPFDLSLLHTLHLVTSLTAHQLPNKVYFTLFQWDIWLVEFSWNAIIRLVCAWR